jgi:transcriptional regulator with XRE-family HTH domain
MATRPSPTLAGMKLGATLADWRRRANCNTKEAAARLDCTHQKIGHIETGRNKISAPELRDLCVFYGVPDDSAAEMEEMRLAAAAPRWWSTFRLPRWLDTFVGLEDGATTAREAQLELIPGLLQIPEYVTALQTVRTLPLDQVAVERAAAARIERQKRLIAPAGPLQFEAVVSEAALRRALGNPAAGPKQIAHLIDMGSRDNVDVRIIPFSRGLHASMSGSFSLLAFDDAPEIGYQEYAFGGHIIDEREVVERMHKIWDELRAQALGADESLRFLAELTGDATHGGSVVVEEV